MTAVFRIDRFAVPADAMPAFLDQLQRIDRLLATLPGCVQHRVLTQAEGEFNVLTLVEWESEAAMAAARGVVQRRYAEDGFDPPTFMRWLGVRPDFGLFAPAREAASTVAEA